MKKKFITYEQNKKIKKAVLDEAMFKNYLNNKDISSIEEYSDEILLEKAYAEKVGKNNNQRKTLLD